MPIKADELIFLRDTTWAEVLEVWRTREEENWRPHYEARGFKTWSDWRMRYNEIFSLPSRTWSLYQVINPAITLPKCLVGAYRGWKRYYPEGVDVATFSELAARPELGANETVVKLSQALPAHRQLIAFRLGDELVIRDGTHHSAAISLATLDQLPVMGETTIALADFEPDEADLFQRSYDQRFAPNSESS